VEKQNFMKKNFLPFFLSNEKNVLPCYLTLGKNVDALLLCHNFFQDLYHKNNKMRNNKTSSSNPRVLAYPASKVLSYFFSAGHGEARETAELVYILCGADNPKTWIIMRNFRLIPVL
jgi:hypothetical protein